MTNIYPLTLAQDSEIHEALLDELNRQENQIELIASENHASLAVMEALGSVLTNKYAEGYPGRRYYGGCEHVDRAENLAKERLCLLLGAEGANVQPSSGSQANQAALLALASPGSRILAMDLNHGGHLSHGHPKNLSGMIYEFAHYGVRRETETIDYEAIETQMADFKPAVLVAGASAYPRKINFKRLAEIAKEHEAYFMVDMAHIAGLVAAGLHDSPVPYADVVTMTTHKTLRGPRGGAIVCKGRHLAAINSAVFPGMQGGPLMHVVAAKAIAFAEALLPEFKSYQSQVLVNAKILSESLMQGGCRLVSGGTDNHLMLVDLRGPEGPGITGRTGEESLHRAGITANKNLIPFDPEKPMETSGLRLGTPAVTTRGFGVEDMKQLGCWMNEVLQNPDDRSLAAKIEAEVAVLCKSRPLYPALTEKSL